MHEIFCDHAFISAILYSLDLYYYEVVTLFTAPLLFLQGLTFPPFMLHPTDTDISS